MERARLSLQMSEIPKINDYRIVFEDSGTRLLRKLMRQYGNLKLFSVRYCAEMLDKEGRLAEQTDIYKLFTGNKAQQKLYEPLNSSFRNSAISAGCRMAYAIHEQFSNRSAKDIAAFIRKRSNDPERQYIKKDTGKIYEYSYKSWFTSAAAQLDKTNIRYIDGECYLRLPNIGMYMLDIGDNPVDWELLSGATIYLRRSDFNIRFWFGKGSRGGQQ